MVSKTLLENVTILKVQIVYHFESANSGKITLILGIANCDNCELRDNNPKSK